MTSRWNRNGRTHHRAASDPAWEQFSDSEQNPCVQFQQAQKCSHRIKSDPHVEQFLIDFTLEFSSPPKGSRNESIVTWRTNVPSLPIWSSEPGPLKPGQSDHRNIPPISSPRNWPQTSRRRLSGQPRSVSHEHSALRVSADDVLTLLRTKQLKRTLYFSVIQEHSEKPPK